MNKIKFIRFGRKNLNFFRVALVTGKPSIKQSSKYEYFGFYNSHTKEFVINNVEKIANLVKNGIQLSKKLKKIINKTNDQKLISSLGISLQP